MKKIFTILSIILLSCGMYAATEQAWYNDVTSITNNGQYYIYSVNGNGFMQAGQAQVKAITTSNYTNVSTYKFKISKADQGYVTNGSYYVRSYMVLTGSSGSGPVCTKQSDDGTKIIWTSMNGGEYWNIHSYYNAWFSDRYPALNYKDNKYDGYMSGSGVSYSNTKDTQTATEYRWYLVSQAQLDRHFAIYFFDAYKETLNIAQYSGLVPAAYYTALEAAYNQTFSVQNAAHSAEVVNAAKTDLETLYNGAADIAAAYATATTAINTLEAVEDKGEDFAEVTSDITNARTALEQAMTVEAVNAAVAGLKQIDPITFQQTTFQALSNVNGAATSAAGRTITYAAANTAIINAEGKAIYAGQTTLTATAAATSEYYKFVRTAQVTVEAPTTYGDFEQSSCDEAVVFNEQSYEESFAGDVTVGKNYMGGDSIVHVLITINHATSGSDSKTIAYGAEESWNGIDLSSYTVGKHTIPFNTTNLAGCDSTVTLTLTVTKQNAIEVPVALNFCEGDQVAYRDTIYTEAGTDEILVEGETVDTLYQVTVTVNYPYYSDAELTKTVGEAVLFEEDGWLLRGETPVEGVYMTTKADTADLWFIHYGQTVLGCDSIERLNIRIEQLDPVETEKELEMCEGEQVEYRGVQYSIAGEYPVLVEDAVRDTLINVIVTVHEKAYAEIERTVLAGEVLTLPEGEWTIGDQIVSGTFETQRGDTLGLEMYQYDETEFGCESVVKLIVTVTPNYEAVENVEAGEKAQKFFRNGVLYIRRGDRLFTTDGREAE